MRYPSCGVLNQKSYVLVIKQVIEGISARDFMITPCFGEPCDVVGEVVLQVWTLANREARGWGYV